MADNSQVITDYDRGTTDTIVRTCLHLATALDDIKEDIVLIGGMAPYFLVDQTANEYVQPHCGSKDVDLVLSVALIDEERYDTIADRLQGSGFEQSLNEHGKRSHQTWRHKTYLNAVVEFLVDVKGMQGKTQHLAPELAAFIAPGVQLAFEDKRLIKLKGVTFDGAKVEREIYVCGPGAFVILKSLALHSGRNKKAKDAYDIDYIVRYFGSGPTEIADTIRPLLGHEKAQEGLAYLEKDFETLDGFGPIHLAIFKGEEGNDELRADCSGLVMELVRLCKQDF